MIITSTIFTIIIIRMFCLHSCSVTSAHTSLSMGVQTYKRNLQRILQRTRYLGQN